MTSEEIYRKWKLIGVLGDLTLSDQIEFSIELEKLIQFFNVNNYTDYEYFLYHNIFLIIYKLKKRNKRVSTTDVYIKFKTFINGTDYDVVNMGLYEQSELIDVFLDIHYKE